MTEPDALDEYDWQIWDRQFETDAAAGKLDELAGQALMELERGQASEI
jgi:hypothetical protein